MTASILDQFRLDGQVALVVGGNRGLGFEMAKALAEAGASICIAARNADRNASAREFIVREYGRECTTAACDITDSEQVAAAVAAVEAKFGRLDILINSAGINVRGAIDAVSPEDFDKVQRVNVTGTWLMGRQAVPLMKRHRYGRIVNIGSMLSICRRVDESGVSGVHSAARHPTNTARTAKDPYG
jgi:gluconate 5-dehydrogenase